ncbi:MAG: hypothetical protein V4725_15200 [Bacteroidota bacterium]
MPNWNSLENFLNAGIPHAFIDECKRKYDSAKSEGKQISEKELIKDVEIFILLFNEQTVTRNTLLDYNFMDELDQEIGITISEDIELGWDPQTSHFDQQERVTNDVSQCYDALISKLRSVFNPCFQHEQAQKMNKKAFFEKWYDEYSNEPFAKHYRTKAANEQNRKYVTLRVSGPKKEEINYEVSRDGIIMLTSEMTKADLIAVFDYNLDVKLKNWLSLNVLGNEDEFWNDVISNKKVLMGELASANPHETDQKRLGRSMEYSYAKLNLELAEKKLKAYLLNSLPEATEPEFIPSSQLEITIGKLLTPCKNAFNNDAEFSTAVDAVASFFNTGIVSLKKPIFVKNKNIKKLASLMGNIWRSQSNEGITYEYLLAYTKIFSIFKDEVINKDVFSNNLYKYSSP